MNTYIFTFGIGHKLGRKYQPIIAKDAYDAREVMDSAHGNDWAFAYTEDKFNSSKESGFFLNLTPLKIINEKEVA